jgi:hypothetical protein
MSQDWASAPAIQAPAVTVRTPVPRSLWQSMHDADVDAMPSQAPQWLECLTATGRYRDASRLYEMPDGRLAILPLVRRTLFSGPAPALHSVPSSWGYGGLVAPEGVDETLVAAVMEDLSKLPSLRIHIRPNPLHAPRWAAASAGRQHVTIVPRKAHVLDLDGGFDRVWKERFKSSVRTDVRRAEKLGVRVETDTTGRLVPVFYDLLLRSFDRWAAQQHEPPWLARLRGRRRDPIEKFHTITERMGERCQISVAWFEDQPAAAIIVLRGGANAHDTRGAMNKALAARGKVNSFLHKTAIEAACRDGCRHYHMGESGASATLAHFKSSFGAQSHVYAEYLIERMPLYRADRAVRNVVKSVIGFRDV